MTLARNFIGFSALRAASINATPTVGRGFAFSTSSRLGLKESTNKDNVDFDTHKQDSLRKQKEGKGHWKPELASDSEEAVKADRAHASQEDTAALQERTKRAAEESSKQGTSVRDNM